LKCQSRNFPFFGTRQYGPVPTAREALVRKISYWSVYPAYCHVKMLLCVGEPENKAVFCRFYAAILNPIIKLRANGGRAQFTPAEKCFRLGITVSSRPAKGKLKRRHPLVVGRPSYPIAVLV
jgi:hypothetical protein